ncbi:acyl-CoA dehydrogenase family protein [Variovorax rhizosphaerae]|uniref:Acyl-CoA dehydrogenase family protein n=1 Tax=Variovorax rhizosphaerae TaxID=1836200 RepID=A0ABU8WZS4_9BURK
MNHQQSEHDENQRSLANAITSFGQRRDPGAADPWPELVAMGLPGLLVPEELGGLGLDGASMHAVMESLGRNRLTTPFAVSAVLCTRLLLALADTEQQARWLPPLAAGEHLLAFAHGEPQGEHLPRHLSTRARRDGDDWILNGGKAVVPHGGESTAWLVSARAGASDMALFWVDAAATGLRVERYPCLDGSIGADLSFDELRLPANACIGSPGVDVAMSIAAATDAATAGLSAESAGLQATLLDMTVDHVKTRRQFGVALGSLQAIQHRLAEMLVAVEQSKSLSWLAALSLDNDAVTRIRSVAAAKVRSTESGRFIGLQSIHLHGGMGMTDELPVGRCVKRLLTIAHSWGDARHHLERLVDLMRAAPSTTAEVSGVRSSPLEAVA